MLASFRHKYATVLYREHRVCIAGRYTLIPHAPMFETLVESKPQRQKSVGQSVVSIILHVVIIALVVVVTAKAGQQDRKEQRQEEIKFVEAPKNEPPPPEPEPA